MAIRYQEKRVIERNGLYVPQYWNSGEYVDYLYENPLRKEKQGLQTSFHYIENNEELEINSDLDKIYGTKYLPVMFIIKDLAEQYIKTN